MVWNRFWGRDRWWMLTAPALLFLTIVYILPIARTIGSSVTDPKPGFGNYATLLGTHGYEIVVLRTIGIGLAVTAICFVLGYPLAYAISRSTGAARLGLLIAVVSPYLTSTLVRTFAWEVLLSRLGPVNQVLSLLGWGSHDMLFTPVAVIIGLVHVSLPLMVLPLVGVMNQVDRLVMRSATSLGAGNALTFIRVFIPLTKPGIELGSLLVFVYSIGAFITPAILGGQNGAMLGSLIQTAAVQYVELGFASAAATTLGIIVAATLALYYFVGTSAGRPLGPSTRDRLAGKGRRRHPAGMSFESLQYGLRTATWRLADFIDRVGLGQSRLPVGVFATVISCFLLIPQLIVVPISFSGTQTLIFPPHSLSLQWYANFLTPDWLGPVWVSLSVGAVVAVAATVLGTLAAVGIVHAEWSTLRSVGSLLILLPLLMPPVIAAIALYATFLPLGLTDSILGLILAHTTLTLPFAFTVMAAAESLVDQRVERAAQSLGAGLLTVLRKVTLRLLMPSLLIALVLSFLVSFDESVVGVFLSGIFVKTLPAAMFDAVTMQSDPTIGVVATVSVAVAAACLVFVSLIERRLGTTARRFL